MDRQVQTIDYRKGEHPKPVDNVLCNYNNTNVPLAPAIRRLIDRGLRELSAQ